VSRYLSDSTVAGAATSSQEPTALELDNGALSRAVAARGMVLLENLGEALPMPGTGPVATFGVGATHTVAGGTGSGQVNNRHTVTVREGFEAAGYTNTTSPAYDQAVAAAFEAKYGNLEDLVIKPAIDYASLEPPLTVETVGPTAPTDTAIFVVARNSGEAADRTSTAGDYLLTDTEADNLALIGQTYSRVVVVLNVGGVVDTSFFTSINAQVRDAHGEPALDALVLMSQAGQESGSALVDVLSGRITPSGKLTDTWASAYHYYPAAATFAGNDGDPLHEQYTEGIYVGYRYFDSFHRSINPKAPRDAVTYPFGYGLSYTTFEVEPLQVAATMQEVQVSARVTNTGTSHAGQEVVQVYFSAPPGGRDKPYQELAGYAKTDALTPGQSQTLTITFPTTEMSSYDEKHARFVLDAGDYLIRIGNSSRNTHVAAKVRIKARTVIEQLSNQANTAWPDDELTSSPANFYRYRGERREIAKAPLVRVWKVRRFDAPNNASDREQGVPVDKSSPLYAIDGDTISETTAYLDRDQTDWEASGAPYAAKDGERIAYVDADPAFTLYDVKAGRATMEHFVAGMSLTQLATIVEGAATSGSTRSAAGAAGYTTPNYEPQGIPGMTLADGPAGLRLTQTIEGDPDTYQYATAWPIGTLLAQTWDQQAVEQVGTALGQEMAAFGVTLWLAPGMNIHRDPLNGRNFEYYSEDPRLSGSIASSMTRGVQAIPGVGVTLKHYVANNQETERNFSDSVVSERALREIYLKGFEIAVKSAQPMAIMTSYNKVNGTYTAGSYDLNEDILRGEWSFQGLVMSDWGAVPRAGLANTLYSGNDLVQPGNTPTEVITAMKQVPPTIDISGLPAYNEGRLLISLKYFYRWESGALALAADGPEVFTTTLDANTDLSKHPASMITIVDAINNATYEQHPPFDSVDAAYREVMSFLAPEHTALTAAQKAAITVTDVEHEYADHPDSPVTAYTITFRGRYPTLGYPLRLGDLQRSVARILTIAMKSAPFAELAHLHGVPGVEVGPYSTQFDDLASYLDTSKGPVQ
jgi:hypothetical protein